ELLTAQAMIEQRRQDGAVALALERLLWRGVEQGARLRVGDRRSLALVAVEVRALDPVDRVMRHGVLLAEIFVERGGGRELAADGGRRELALGESVAPGDDMGAGDGAELFRPGDAGEAAEVGDVVAVGAAGSGIMNISEPFELG